MFCKLKFEARNHWYAPTSVSRERIAKEKKQESTSEKNNGSSIWDNLPCHFSLWSIDGSGKVLKLLCVCVCAEGSYFQKAKNCTNDFESRLVIVWAIDVDDVICEGCKRNTNELDSMLLSCHCYLKLSLIIWSTHFPVSVVLELQLYR